jgi:sarcosine oxidase gamma subunit
LSVDQISLVVENLKTHGSLSTNVASLLSLNAGVDVSMDKVNLTIAG